MDGMYGIGSNSSFMNTFFGTSKAGGGSSLYASLGDLQMIRAGAYKKAMKSYMAKTSDVESTSVSTADKSEALDSKNDLSNMKSSAKKLYDAADKLKKSDFSKDAKTEDLLGSVKEFAKSYNETLSSAKKLNSYSMVQTAVWGTEQMNMSESLLNKVGITIENDNTLSVDEDKFKAAKMSDVKALFSGNGSLADRIGQKASTLYNQSANQLSVNQGKMTYTMYGTLGR